jgi:soluble lytic murein transglycosylase
MGARGGLDLDEFVEEIPVEETRGYVKRVLRSYAAYRLLYATPREAAGPGLLHRDGKS